MWCSKRNQLRQPVNIDVDMESHRKTDMKDPKLKGQYREILDEHMWMGWTKSPHQWTMRIIIECVDDTMRKSTHHEERGSTSNWPLLIYLQVFKHYYQFHWVINAVSSYSTCIGAFRVILREINVVHITFCLYFFLNSEIVKMSTSSTVSVPLIPIRESNQRAIIFTIELLRGQALSPVHEFWHHCKRQW